jgi:hypothetical protein
VIRYYTPQLHTQVLRSGKPTLPRHGRIFLLASFLDQAGVPQAVGTAKYALAQAHRRLIATDTLEKIYVWEYR